MEKTLIGCKSIASIEPSEKTPDLLSIKFILCHELDNANKDVWLKEVLEAVQPTAKNKYINWQHQSPILGTIISSEMFFDNSVNRNALKCEGYLWRFTYPHLCEAILNSYQNGDLKMSFEAYFPDAFFVRDLADLEDKSKYISYDEFKQKGYKLGTLYRVFALGTFIAGCGVVSSPADESAWILEVAERKNPIKDYHKRLHLIYEHELFDILPEEVVIAEHSRLHREFGIYLK